MKACVLVFVSALAAVSQTPTASRVIRCKDATGRACTAKQVQTLSDAVFAGKRQHDALAEFKELTLAPTDGTLKCAQNNGSACSIEQLDLVKEFAGGQQLYINYNAAQPKTGK